MNNILNKKTMDSSSMPWQTFKSLLCLFFTVFYTLSSAAYQPYRNNLPQPTLEIYRSILQYAEIPEFDKIKKYLELIKPVTTVLKEKYRVDSEHELLAALSKKDKTTLVKHLRHLIYLDIQDLLSSVSELEQGQLSIEHTQESIQTAYLTYLLLSPIVQDHYFAEDQQIKKNFRIIVLILIRITPYKGEIFDISNQKETMTNLDQRITEINTTLKTALELK